MTNFNHDDIDLLSDGSGDSFFEEPHVIRKQSLTKMSDKKSIFSDSKDNLTEENLIRNSSQNISNILNKPTKSNLDNDDILSSLGFEKKPNPIRQLDVKRNINKSNLIETILGPSKQETEESSDVLKERPVSASKNVSFSLTDGRRSRNQPSGGNLKDPLGLFSNKPSLSQSADTLLKENTESNNELNQPKSLKPKTTSNLPEWLNTGLDKKQKSESDIPSVVKMQEEEIKKPSLTENFQNSKGSSEIIVVSDKKPPVQELNLAESQIEYQNTFSKLQHQESQLLMTLQLKKYEENLADLQLKQKEIILKQEKQMNYFVEQQLLKQQIMENNVRLQQESILNRVQSLLSQPSNTYSSESLNVDDNRLRKNRTEDYRLLEEFVKTLKERQQEEISLLNDSYRKQINLLENSMETIEVRLKSELSSLSEQFKDTISTLKDEHVKEIEYYKQKLKEMAVTHEKEILSMRENHSRAVDDIRHEYQKVLESFKKAKELETYVMDNASSYTHKLDSSLNILHANTETLNNVQNRIQSDYGVLNLAREESLKVKEQEINLMKTALEKSRESSEMERIQLMALVKSLETKLMEQTQNSREESWSLQQAIALLSARSSAFDREVEFTKSALERERQQLKTLKESMLGEQEKAMLQITEEKLLIAAERSRLETAAKLHKNFQSQKTEVEIDSAIQVAKEAAALSNRERETFYEKQKEIELIRKSLLDREENLKSKQSELQEMHKNAEIKARENDKILSEAKLLEAKYNVRLRDIQGQLVSLTNREKKLVEEKIALSKERLALHSNAKRIAKCTLCTVDNVQSNNEIANDLVEQDFPPHLLTTVTDSNLLRLHYEINEDHR